MEIFSAPAPPFGGAPPPRLIHEDLPHQVRGDPEEVRPALPIRHVLRHQAQVRFVHQRRGRCRRRGAFVPKAVIGQTAQFPVDERDEKIERFLVSVLPVEEQLSNAPLGKPLGRTLHDAIHAIGFAGNRITMVSLCRNGP